MLIAYFFSLQSREFTASTLYFVDKILFSDQTELSTAKKTPELFKLMLIGIDALSPTYFGS